MLDGRGRALASGATVWAQSPGFRSLLLDRRRTADLYDQAGEAAERIGATWVQCTDADGVRFTKSDDPAAPPASLGETALVGGALA